MLVTPRLLLRSWTQDDLPALAAVLGDAEVMRFSDAGPLGHAARQDWLSAVLSDPRCQTRAIERRSDGACLGYLSLKRDPARLGEDVLELGIRLARHAWGEGLAREACLYAFDEARQFSDAQRIQACVDPHNAASLKLMAALGMTQVGEIMLPGFDYPDSVFALDL